jgi:hypothetical protein
MAGSDFLSSIRFRCVCRRDFVYTRIIAHYRPLSSLFSVFFAIFEILGVLHKTGSEKHSDIPMLLCKLHIKPGRFDALRKLDKRKNADGSKKIFFQTVEIFCRYCYN